mmetsp:Transcript_15305/g.39790  ORF Transcript_15305/g.39790 Transcript_15305/m.39790 type:complete len:233 (+) Transcript_15305:1396-2094(+)
MITSPAFTSTRFITMYSSLRCASFRWLNRKLVLTAAEMRWSSSGVLGVGLIASSIERSSSAATDDCAVMMSDFFSLDSPRRTGRLPSDWISRPIEIRSPPRLESLLRSSPNIDFLRVPSCGTESPFAMSRTPSSFQSRKMRMMVISSVRTSYWSHSRYASATMARAPSSGSSYCETMSAAPWLVMNSKIPSLARRMNLSSRVISLDMISGSAYTPMSSAIASPIERVNAQPG